MQDIKKNFGQLDAVVNCAGIAFAYRLYNSNKRKMADMDRYKKTLEVGTAKIYLN
jgi:short-subunit dehydrogenase involved in D-alanine esterification of teichoic acids